MGNPTDERAFEAEVAALEAGLETLESDRCVLRLRALHEARARSLLGVTAEARLVDAVRAKVEADLDPGLAALAFTRLADATQWQWEIGTWASAGGEGLVSMFQVRTLQLASAWLHAARVSVDAEAGSEALRLADEVDHAPNNVAASLRPHVVALRSRLAPR